MHILDEIQTTNCLPLRTNTKFVFYRVCVRKRAALHEHYISSDANHKLPGKYRYSSRISHFLHILTLVTCTYVNFMYNCTFYFLTDTHVRFPGWSARCHTFRNLQTPFSALLDRPWLPYIGALFSRCAITWTFFGLVISNEL